MQARVSLRISDLSPSCFHPPNRNCTLKKDPENDMHTPPTPAPLLAAEIATELIGAMESSAPCGFGTGNEDGPAAGNGDGGRILRAGLSIAEWRAAKSGFSLRGARLNTARFRTWPCIGNGSDSPPPPVSEHSLTCFTISPGISPTALLGSPVMLPDSQNRDCYMTRAQVSPTTGTFSVASFADDASSVVHTATPNENDGDEGVRSSFTFGFKHAEYPSPNSVFLEMEPYQGIDAGRNGFSVRDTAMQVDFPPDITWDGGEKNFTIDSLTGKENLSNMSLKTGCRDSLPCISDASSGQTALKSEANDMEENPDLENEAAAEAGDNKETYSSLPEMSRNSEDGYNWRKYGQKQVKGSEFPRSYYKCTHPSCPVKKQVERSLNGQITEIIYKGAHNHPKPHPARRGAIPTAFLLNEMPETSEDAAETFVKVGSESQIWRNGLVCSKDIGPLGSEWRSTGLERTPSMSLITELCDTAATTVQRIPVGLFDHVQTLELSFAMASHDDGNEEGATQGPGEDADDDELESKRRRSENCSVEANLSSRAIREPRVVIQIESEIDILDDGYRWRKYGQKVVKGNPNPRSYYKCTSAGCPVRKHVERASNDLECVVTAYEGKHNHGVPVARNGCHVPTGSGSLGPGSATGQTNLTMPRNPPIPKQEGQAHDLSLLDRKPEFANDFLWSSLLVNFGNDMRCGASPLFPVMYPPLQNGVLSGPYGQNPGQTTVHPPGSIAALAPEFPISMPFKYPQLRKVPMTGLEFHQHRGKAATACTYDHPSISGQCVKEEAKYITPKQERADSLFEACIPVMDPPGVPPSSMFWPLIGGGYPT
ncbi:hypothetical protein MLD38_035807 [Melastoma candidum]|uniref:Uncharacterized protein n=1 Tax=Melastoma candidum TaxID=119954 RepID=A0ACB9LHP9_9MYRT|nr:hypothetical protein MLD38_035807 [Melastoma candidum]